MSNEYLDIAVEMVVKQEVNKALDKIMTEIESEKIEGFAARNGGLEIALRIIDKYKESE